MGRIYWPSSFLKWCQRWSLWKEVTDEQFNSKTWWRFVFGTEISPEQPSKKQIVDLFYKASKKAGKWPNKVWISKKDPFISIFKTVCDELKLPFASDLTARELKPYVYELEKSFIQFKRGDSNDTREELDDDEAENLKAFIPETYGPCPCG